MHISLISLSLGALWLGVATSSVISPRNPHTVTIFPNNDLMKQPLFVQENEVADFDGIKKKGKFGVLGLQKHYGLYLFEKPEAAKTFLQGAITSLSKGQAPVLEVEESDDGKVTWFVPSEAAKRDDDSRCHVCSKDGEPGSCTIEWEASYSHAVVVRVDGPGLGGKLKNKAWEILEGGVAHSPE